MNRPGVKYGGLVNTDQSPQETLPVQVTSHTPLFLILSSDGSEHSEFHNATTATVYGDMGTLPTSVHHTHQATYLDSLLTKKGNAFVKRIVLPDATRASLRVSLEIVLSSLPLFDRNEFGQFIVDEFDEPVPIGSLDGFRVIAHVSQGVTVGGGAVIQHHRSGNVTGDLTSEYLGVVEINEQLYFPDSALYPLFDLEYEHFGSGGNATFVEITQGETSPFRLTVYRDGKVLGSHEFSLDGDLDRLDLIKLPAIRRAVVYNDSIRVAKELLLYGTDYQNVHYNGVDDYLEIFEPEVVNDAAKATLKANFDLFGLSFKNGVPYPIAINDSKWFGGSDVSSGIRHRFGGGSDGYPIGQDGEVDRLELLKVFDTMASNLYRSIGLGHHNLSDPVRYPYRSIYDSGYSMQTKMAIASIKRSRPEVQIFLTPYSVAEWLPKEGKEINCSGALIDGAIAVVNSGERYTLEVDGQVVGTSLTMLQLYTALNSHPKMECELLQQPLRSTRFFTSQPYPSESDFELRTFANVVDSRLREVPSAQKDVELTASLGQTAGSLKQLTIDTSDEVIIANTFTVGSTAKLATVTIDTSHELSFSASMNVQSSTLRNAAIDTEIDDVEFSVTFDVQTSSLKTQE